VDVSKTFFYHRARFLGFRVTNIKAEWHLGYPVDIRRCALLLHAFLHKVAMYMCGNVFKRVLLLLVEVWWFEQLVAVEVMIWHASRAGIDRDSVGELLGGDVCFS